MVLFLGLMNCPVSFGEENPVLVNPPANEEISVTTPAIIPSQESPGGEVTPQESEQSLTVMAPSEPQLTPEEFVKKAWASSGANDIEKVIEITTQCQTVYGKEADQLNSQLTDFPPQSDIDKYKTMNDVATCLFIRAEALMSNGRMEEAKTLFEEIMKRYRWAQAWDPRGWYWSVEKKSKASIRIITGEGREEDFPKVPAKTVKTRPKIYFSGKDKVVDYTKYGQFINAGTQDYQYVIKDPVGLQKAVGEGIYPDTGNLIKKDPNYEKVKKAGRLEGSHWDFVHTDDLEAAFYKWATSSEPWGVKLFYIGLIFEKAGMYTEALKAYHAIVVHFPNATARTYWNTPWYPGQTAIAKIRYIVRTHPELELGFKWAKIQVVNGFDNNVANDQVITYPGVIVQKTFWDKLKEWFNFDKKVIPLKGVKRKIGDGKVQLVQYENDHWQMQVEGKPFVVRGITYAPTKVGQSPDKGTLKDWMTEDENVNGRADGPYDSWVDKNLNNQQDADEPVVGDFQLMRELGANVLRVYHQPFEPNKELLRKLSQDHGIMVMMGDFLGKYAIGSGASWYEGTDYENPEHRKNMLESVKKMVLEFKDEPYLLLWILGNENNYGVACNADKKPEAYYRFVNEVAQWIKSVDKNHPVAICNGDTLYLDVFAQAAPDVDIFSANAYRGEYGFGAFWEQVADATGKPAFLSEYGCPAFAAHMTREEAEEAQANYHKGNWLDIVMNMAGGAEGVGNALGGVVFEWMDEWWKNYEPFLHDKTAGAIGPFPDGYMYEEWFGLIGQGDGQHSPFMRQLRKSYFLYKDFWQKK